MRKLSILLAFLSISLFYSCTTSNSNAQTSAVEMQEATTAKNISAKDFQQIIKTNESAIILDVRTPKEVAAGHLANALYIDFYDPDFKIKVSKLDKTKPILIYCHSGRRSGIAMSNLREMGFVEVYNLETGILGWNSAGFPIEK
jgi:rhodanese-related sulfurtransferase